MDIDYMYLMIQILSKMRINKFTLFLFLGLTSSVNAQVTLSNGENSLEISGVISTYYNYRTLENGVNEKDKNRFNLRDAQIQLEGRNGKNWEYKLQVDFADLTQGSSDPENPGLMDAWIQYKGLKWFDVRIGFGKIAWSRSSLTPFIYSAYWQRAEFLRGGFLSRRDIGLDISKSFWKQRASIDLGVYTGLGEVSLKGDNDASGALEYTGRLTLGWPTQFRNREIDDRHVRKPMIGIGLSARYTNRKLPEGAFFPAGAASDYGIKVINGEKRSVGFDIAAQWQGISAQFELIKSQNTPQDSISSYFQGFSNQQTGGYFISGGWTGQLNYHIKPLKLILSARYETFNANDLLIGENERLSSAIAYQIDGYQSMIKAQFIHIISAENINAPDWVDQYRIGWQYQF
jgi:hypothetical protein